MCFFFLLLIVVAIVLDDKRTKLQLEIYRLKNELSRRKVEIAKLRSVVDGLRIRNTTTEGS